MQELIRTENTGRSTKVYVAGIEIGKALSGFSLEQTGEKLGDPHVTLSFSINHMLDILSKVPKEDFEKARALIESYFQGREQAVICGNGPED